MINAAETVMPKNLIASIINAADTLPPSNSLYGKSSSNIVLMAGETISDTYVINTMLDKKSSQSNVYIAKKWGKTYIVKVYKDGWKPSDRMQRFLVSVKHPNIASVIENGIHKGNYYEIYEHYSEGTLSDSKMLPVSVIQKVLVPSINEGLHELHSNGIIHCDIKPGNLFFADNNSRIVIGDCGISGYANSNGKMIDGFRGTPEYSPRVKSIMGRTVYTSAYDYGSFGLVLIQAVLGKSLFSGMSVEEIASAWDNGLELPSQINGRLSSLIKGLITENEDERWGYMQVKRWCEAEFVSTTSRSLYSDRKKNTEVRPLVFGRINGEMLVVTTLHQLATAIKENWAQATKVIKKRELLDFVRGYKRDSFEEVKKLSTMTDVDAAVFKLLTMIDDEPTIYYRDKKYGSVNEFVKVLESGKDENAKRFVATGLLIHFLRNQDVDVAQVDKLEQLISRNGCSDMTSISTICFALQNKKEISVFGSNIRTLDDLIHVLSNRSTFEIKTIIESNEVIAWLNRMGYEKEMRRMKEIE